MKKFSIGQKLYVSIIAVFLLFTMAFMLFQQKRERQYKIERLNDKLQFYNRMMWSSLPKTGLPEEKNIQQFIDKHPIPGLRITFIDAKGKVFFDNLRKNYRQFNNHLNRKEVVDALLNGEGYDIERRSNTLKHDYFYSATWFQQNRYLIRSALPYNTGLIKTLQADQHYWWFALTALLILILVLYRFLSRLGANITKLQLFASRADHNESLDSEDLIDFPNDELGEIAERIIKIYKRLQTTREEQNVLKRQLTQNIAHELKTPVASIQGYLETILDNPHISEEVQKQFIQRCHAQSLRLTALLQDISTLNRLDDAPDLVDFTEVDITQIVRNIHDETALQLQERKMVFDNELPPSVVVKGNAGLLYSVFRNLLDNAIAYAGEATIVTLKAEEDMQKWLFTFSDNGVGVPYEHLSRLFERFYRVDKGRSRKMGGTGLGLSIVKNAILLHGGSISVVNREEGGLRFDFSLKK